MPTTPSPVRPPSSRTRPEARSPQPSPEHRRLGLVRVGQLVFALFCAGTALVLSMRKDGVFPVIQTAGVISYLLAAPLVATSALALRRPARAARARRKLIVFHLLFIPLQFLFSFGNFEPLAGMVLSAVFVVLLEPRFPRLGRRARKVWLTVHIGVAVSWLGLSLAMTVLAFAGLTADTHAVRHGAYELMHLFDLALVIPSMALAVVSGVVLSLGTPWGLVRHWWVLIKFVIALSLPTFAAFVESKWIRSLQALTKDPAAEPGGTGVALVVCLATFTVLLWVAVILSVVKPGGSTRWGRGGEGAGRERVRAAGRAPSDRRVPAPETPLTVTDVQQVAEDVVSLELRHANGGTLPPWQPGSHIDLVLPSGMVRQYSLFADPGEQNEHGAERPPAAYRIAVLREPDGRGGSVEAQALRPGASVAIRGPRNNFPLVEAPAYAFLAGGIGITPLLPMIRRLDAEGADWKLLYRGRTRSAMAFADELIRQYPGRVGVSASDTDPRPCLDELLSATPKGVAVYCCGPAPMVDAVSAAMRRACPHGRLYVEHFTAVERSAPTPDEPFEAELTRTGEVVRVEAGSSLLDALREVKPTLDFSCADGICGSCETRVISGTPDHRDSVLQEHERDRRDVIYPCVSRARGRRIALDL